MRPRSFRATFIRTRLGPYHEIVKSNLHLHTLFNKNVNILPRSSKSSLPFRVSTKIYDFSYLMRAKCPAHHILLDLIHLITSDE